MKYFIILLLLTVYSSSVSSNDYFKALELFNLRKIEESVDFLKKLQMMNRMKKEAMQCLILL